MKRILVRKGEVRQLSIKFGLTPQSIRNALRGITGEGQNFKEIRREALARGGNYERKKAYPTNEE